MGGFKADLLRKQSPDPPLFVDLAPGRPLSYKANLNPAPYKYVG